MHPGTRALQLREERKRRMMKERMKTRRRTTTSRVEELRLDERECVCTYVCVLEVRPSAAYWTRGSGGRGFITSARK